jgi:hypothetical protein
MPLPSLWSFVARSRVNITFTHMYIHVCVCVRERARARAYDYSFMTFKNMQPEQNTFITDSRPYISFILYLELQWANLWSVRALQLGIKYKRFPYSARKFSSLSPLAFATSYYIYILCTKNMSIKILPGSRKRFGSESVRLHKIFCRSDKSYFSTYELMHRENVKRKMMKTENKQVCCEEKC